MCKPGKVFSDVEDACIDGTCTNVDGSALDGRKFKIHLIRDHRTVVLSRVVQISD